MFDRIERHVHAGPSRVDVHEHRAPTDDSIRVFDELRAKAEASVLATMRVEGNDVRGTVVIQTDPSTIEMKAVFLFRLNGRDHRIDVPLPRQRMIPDPPKLGDMLRDELAKAIAGELVFDNAGVLVERLLR